jgi:hypothetical protein
MEKTSEYSYPMEVTPRRERMTLRDRFAAKALEGLLARGWTEISDVDYKFSTAKIAYQFADAMLEAREQK